MYEISWLTAFHLWNSKPENLSRALVISILLGVLIGGLTAFAALAGITYQACEKLKKTWLVCENFCTDGRCGFLVDRREKYCGGCGNKIPEMLRSAEPPDTRPPDPRTNP